MFIVQLLSFLYRTCHDLEHIQNWSHPVFTQLKGITVKSHYVLWHCIQLLVSFNHCWKKILFHGFLFLQNFPRQKTLVTTFSVRFRNHLHTYILQYAHKYIYVCVNVFLSTTCRACNCRSADTTFVPEWTKIFRQFLCDSLDFHIQIICGVSAQSQLHRWITNARELVAFKWDFFFKFFFSFLIICNTGNQKNIETSINKHK